MKTVVDYLKKNKKFEGEIGGHAVKISLNGKSVIMECDDSRYVFNAFRDDVANQIQDALYDHHGGIEIRFCDVCGTPYDMGFIAGDGDWYCCQNCFKETMNLDYGEDGWRSTDEEGQYGGYYEYRKYDGEWVDTGIYYTEWN